LGDSQLDDAPTVADYNIVDGTTLEMVERRWITVKLLANRYERLDVAADEMIAAGERRSFDRPDSLRGAVKADAARLREGVEDGGVLEAHRAAGSSGGGAHFGKF
jgi:hypothetical protein